MKTRRMFVVYVVLLVGLVALVFSVGQLMDAQTKPLRQQDAVIEQAIEQAQSRGFQGTSPDAIASKETTLAEWFSIIGFEPGPDSTKVGLDPNRKIWIVTMRGSVQWSGPGKQSDGPGDFFDNISISLDADTLEYIGAYSAGQTEKIPLGVSR
jgi:hypothetical protein